MRNTLLRKKNINSIRNATNNTELKKVLGLFDLIAMGIGAVVGTGIFVLTGIQAATVAGPAVVVSFILSGFTAIFVALCYTEVAAAMPSSGGAYTYSYSALGEIFAWLVGWMVITQCTCSVTAVATGWSGYVAGVLTQLNIHIPEMLLKNPFEGGIIDLPAFLICILITLILVKGIQESIVINTILVFVKLVTIFIFLGVSVPHFNIENWSNFMPFGFGGVTAAAGALFLAYTGFDAIANAAEECKNPTRDITIGLIGSLVFCTILYVLVAGMLTGIADYSLLNNKEALAYALRINGSNIGGALVAAGGITGMTTVMLFQQYAQTRVLMSMSRDGLLPKSFSKIHPKTSTPYIATLWSGAVAAVLSAFVPIAILGNLASLGSLAVLFFVTLSTIRLRITKPNMTRSFKCPMLYVIGPIAMACCAYLIIGLMPSVGLIFGTWVALGLVIYFLYSRRSADKVYLAETAEVIE